MIPKTNILLIVSAMLVSLMLCSCSRKSEPVASSTPAAPGASAVAGASGKYSCKDFPVVLYPHTTSASCEENPQREDYPLHYTANLQSPDSVQQVTNFYQTQVQSAGWTPKPSEVQNAGHAVVVIEKGKGYASIVINTGDNKSGSHTQISAFPNGNDLK